MKIYFSHIDADHWTAKNNSEKQAHQAAIDMNHKLISANQVKKFISDFKEKISKINSNNKRCKPLLFDEWKPSDGITNLMISGVFQMSLYEVVPGKYDSTCQ